MIISTNKQTKTKVPIRKPIEINVPNGIILQPRDAILTMCIVSKRLNRRVRMELHVQLDLFDPTTQTNRLHQLIIKSLIDWTRTVVRFGQCAIEFLIISSTT